MINLRHLACWFSLATTVVGCAPMRTTEKSCVVGTSRHLGERRRVPMGDRVDLRLSRAPQGFHLSTFHIVACEREVTVMRRFETETKTSASGIGIAAEATAAGFVSLFGLNVAAHSGCNDENRQPGCKVTPLESAAIWGLVLGPHVPWVVDVASRRRKVTRSIEMTKTGTVAEACHAGGLSQTTVRLRFPGGAEHSVQTDAKGEAFVPDPGDPPGGWVLVFAEGKLVAGVKVP